ncbi:MAG: hypothetical protein ACOCRX_06270 [Candidatus Woesearchaeota archaeon]
MTTEEKRKEANEKLEEIKEEIVNKIDEHINDGARLLTVDERKNIENSFANLTISKDVIVVEDTNTILIPKSNVDKWLYFAGFEYIDSDDVEEIGGYMIFSDNERVEEIIELIEEVKGEQ